MKFILKIGVAISLVASVLVSCDKDTEFTGLEINAKDIEIGAEGGTHRVDVSSNNNWTATGSDAWIFISPANGNAFTECKIKIDSTHMSESREGTVVFRIEGVEKVMKISQMGFDKKISVVNNVVDLPSFATHDKQFFDVDVTTNVPFKIEFSDADAATWLSYDEFDLGLNANYRPRTTKIRFNWELNTRSDEKNTNIKFVPIADADKNASIDVIGVSQEGAEEIVPSRAGDSLSVISINRVMRVYSVSGASGSSMMHWPNVKLWTRMDIKRAIEEEEKRDVPDLQRIEAIKGFEGRVRVASFALFETNKALPYEVQFLDAAEEISFRSNISHQKYSLSIGEYITQLKYLKRLTVFAYGLNELPASMVNMKRLEYLDLSANVFDESPVDIVNKENFPNMKVLNFAGCRRVDFISDMRIPGIENPGLRGELPVEWFAWDGLELLILANNFYQGTINDMKNVPGITMYTAADPAAVKNPRLIGTPKVLPNCFGLGLNLNRLHGDLPEWILEHPNLEEWHAEVLVYNQEGIDSNGITGGFDNIPN